MTVGSSKSGVADVTSPPTAQVANVNDNPSGVPTIDGTKVVSNLLTANTSAIADEDGLGSFSYQWKRDSSAISGATDSTYRLVDADASTSITVTVSYTDTPRNHSGNAESITSQGYSVSAPSVSISGTATEDQTLALNLNNFIVNSYQWKRNTSNISGATSATYQLVQDDVGKTITCTVTNNNNLIADITTSATGQVANVNDNPTGTVSIAGTLKHTNVLTASNTLDDEDVMGTVSYQWNRDNAAISGATNSTYTLVDADIGSKISVTASYTDGQSTAESVTSTQTDTIVASTISITGTVQEDEQLSVNLEDVMGTVSYQWKRGGNNISGATNSTYTLVQSDVDTTITVTVGSSTGVNAVTSPPTASVANVNDLPQGAVTLTGTGIVSNTLSFTHNITDEDGIANGAITFQWKSGTNNVGNGSTSYILTSSDAGKDIKVVASYTDNQSNAHTVESSAISVVAATVSISGTATEDQILSVSTNLQGKLDYQWKRGTTNVGTANQYTLGQADVGSAITVTVGTDVNNVNDITSNATANVANLNDSPQGSVTIAGTRAVSNTLTASNTLTDEDGMGTVSYQWYRDNAAISDATDSTYSLVDADESKQISVVAAYLDDQSTAQVVSSAQTAIAAPSVSISGTATEDQILSVSTNLQGNLNYQWKRGGNNISGATNSTYTLVQSDVGYAITVTVGSSKSGVADVTSLATAQLANVNDNPSGVPTIDGTKVVSNLLTANTSAIADEDGLGSFSYQWKRAGNAISGATSQTYELVDDDAGNNITVTVSYTDSQSTEEEVTSGPTAVVANPYPSILGTATQDQTLSLNLDNFIADSYQWKRGTTNVGTGATYDLVQADVGETITCIVTNNNVNIADKTTSATASVQNVNDPAVGLPTISGSLFVSQQLTADASPISDEDGINNSTIAYQWKRNGVAISGATSSTYSLVDADNGTSITVSVSYDDNSGNSHSVDSLASTIADYSVSITGTERENYSLTASANNLAGTVAYQWVRNSDNTTVSTSATYTLVAADIDSTLTVTVSSGSFAKSKTSATVQAENEASGTVTVSTSGTGKFLVGETYQIDTSGISDADDDDGTLSFAYSTVFQKYSDSAWVTAQDNGEDIIETTANIVLATRHNNLRPVTTVTSTDSLGGVTQLTSVIEKIIVTDPGSQVTNSYSSVAEDDTLSTEDIASTFKSALFTSVGKANANFVVSVSSNNTNLIQFSSATIYTSASNQASDPITFNPTLESNANGNATATVSYSVDGLVRFTENVAFVVSAADDDDGAGISVSASYSNGSITINFNSSSMIDSLDGTNSYYYQLVHINSSGSNQLFSDTDNMRSTTAPLVTINLGSDTDETAINNAINSVQGDVDGDESLQVRIVAKDEHGNFVGSSQSYGSLSAAFNASGSPIYVTASISV